MFDGGKISKILTALAEITQVLLMPETDFVEAKKAIPNDLGQK